MRATAKRGPDDAGVGGHRRVAADDLSTAHDVEALVARLADLVLKLNAVADRARLQVPATAREMRLARLDIAIALARDRLLRVSVEAPPPDAAGPRTAAGRSTLSIDERSAWLRLVVAEQARAVDEAGRRHAAVRADARAALDALRRATISAFARRGR